MINEKKLIEDIHKYFYKKIEELTGEVYDDSPVTKEERELYTMNKEICRIIKAQPTIEPYGTWIPCSERLPEEKINPITQDYYEYQVTAVFGNEKCIRCYKFGNGHWWHGGIILDERVLAWMPSLEPYRKEKK